ncbi:MAG: hypothetical protein ACRDHY_06775, partial [Anaerolineales bacterium]
ASITPSTAPSPPALTTPPGSTTPVQPTPELTHRPSGGELIDAVIGAVEGQDAAAIKRLIHYFVIACTGSEGSGAVPCPQGREPGATVSAFGTGSCEGRFILLDDPAAATAVSRFVAVRRDLYAVVHTRPFPEEERVPGKYMVVFRDAAGYGSAVSVDEEGITYLHEGCGTATPPESFTRGSTDYLIPPQ